MLTYSYTKLILKFEMQCPPPPRFIREKYGVFPKNAPYFPLLRYKSCRREVDLHCPYYKAIALKFKTAYLNFKARSITGAYILYLRTCEIYKPEFFNSIHYKFRARALFVRPSLICRLSSYLVFTICM